MTLVAIVNDKDGILLVIAIESSKSRDVDCIFPKLPRLLIGAPLVAKAPRGLQPLDVTIYLTLERVFYLSI